MAVTQQLARIPTEYLAACRHSADTSQDRDPQWDPPTCDVLDLGWAPILLAGLGEVAGLEEVRLDAPRRATARDTALDLGFLDTHPNGIAPFRPAPTALSAAQAHVSALLGQIDMPALLPAVPTDDREARAVISHGTDQLTGSPREYLRRWLSSRGIRHRLARNGIDSSRRLGRHRWVVERTVS